ncbi:MAG TPA: flagellar biosynthesis anti-sigma factor FlgM [Firmicutes bacterium]|nr:flagellar biosynthesis anti-sigma factor FlgM [Bacillota bacterium]
MLISLTQVQEALRVQLQKTQVRRADKAEKVGPGLGVDRVSLSAESKELQAVRQAVAQAAEVREDRVAELREAIRTGTYSATGEEIAESMLARSLADKLR